MSQRGWGTGGWVCWIYSVTAKKILILLGCCCEPQGFKESCACIYVYHWTTKRDIKLGGTSIYNPLTFPLCNKIIVYVCCTRSPQVRETWKHQEISIWSRKRRRFTKFKIEFLKSPYCTHSCVARIIPSRAAYFITVDRLLRFIACFVLQKYKNRTESVKVKFKTNSNSRRPPRW